MTRFVQPLFALFIGIALVIYGLHHVAVNVPAREVVTMFWSAMPSIGTILVFVLGLAVVIAGITLATTGALGVRKRYRQVKTIYGRGMEPDDGDEETGYQAGYRYG